MSSPPTGPPDGSDGPGPAELSTPAPAVRTPAEPAAPPSGVAAEPVSPAADAVPPIWAIGPAAVPNGGADGGTDGAVPAGDPYQAPPPDWVAVVDQTGYRPTPRDRVIEGLAALAVALVLTGMGAALAYVWAAISPRVVLEMTSDGPVYVQPNPEGYVAGESIYLLLTAGLGIVSAVLVWVLVGRRRGPVLLVGLAVGSVAGAVLMAWLGQRIGLSEYQRLLTQAPVGSRFEVPVKVRSAIIAFGDLKIQGAVLVQAMIAVAIYTCLAGFYPTASLRPERATVRFVPPDGQAPPDEDPPHGPPPDGQHAPAAGGVSSDWPAPSDHRAAQAPPATG